MKNNRYGHDATFNKEKEASEKLVHKYSVLLPVSTSRMLKEIGADKLPVSQLIAIAVHNELETATPFVLRTEWIKPYIEYEHAHDAQLLLKYIQLNGERGISLMNLIIFRRDYGINSDENVYYAYRELKELKMIEEFYPRSKFFIYPLNHRHAKAVKTFKEIKNAKRNRK